MEGATNNQSLEQVLSEWTERDLTSQQTTLAPAFEVSGSVEQIRSLLANSRSVILVGESGVGKTAIVHEFVRRLDEFEDLEHLKICRIVQLSFTLRLATAKKPEDMGKHFAELTDVLSAPEALVIPFFRDADLAEQLGLESQLANLCLRTSLPVICEGHPAIVNTMLEDTPELEQHFSTVTIEEPSLERAQRLLERWSAHRARRAGKRFDSQALEEALHLSHRFLARSRLPRKAIDLLQHAAAQRKNDVDVAAVIEHFCRVHQTPRWLIDPQIVLDIDTLEERLRTQLLGQDEAIDAAVTMIAMLKTSLSDLRRPFGVFLFVGPTGVGKTHLAQILAEELFGSRDRILRINLGDYGEGYAASQLFGDANAYSVRGRRGVLTQRLMSRPFGVLLLDEFEKADAGVHDRFLPLVDEGSFVNGAGELISCRSSIIIATSNAGAEIYRGHGLGFTPKNALEIKTRELDQRIQEQFRFELLNRFDRVVHFHPLSRTDIRAVALRELESLSQRAGLRRRGLGLRIDEAVLDWLAVHGYHAEFGARFLRRTVERHVTSAVAETIVRVAHGNTEGAELELYVRRNRIAARLLSNKRTQSASYANTAVNPPPKAVADAQTLEDPHELLERAGQLFDMLEHGRKERDALLERINSKQFWSRDKQKTDVLEQFRELDVSINVQTRYARPITLLQDAMTEGLATLSASRKDALIRGASEALKRWQERVVAEGPSAAWLVISAVDTRPPGEWLRALAKLETAWCRRAALECTALAFELRAGELARIILDVAGPGAMHYLAMEAGVHRQVRSGQPDARARIDLLAKPEHPRPLDVKARGCGAKPGPLGITAHAEAIVALPARGLKVSLLGSSVDALGPLASHLKSVWADPRRETVEIARIYGETGAFVRDPRSGATAPWRAVAKGRLDPFLDSFNAQGESPDPFAVR